MVISGTHYIIAIHDIIPLHTCYKLFLTHTIFTETRQQMKLHVPIFRTNICQRIIRYKGAVIYNYFADIVPQHLSINAMKHHVKKYLLYNSLETT